jgi:F0F1-type ATP synthase assembly protein I
VAFFLTKIFVSALVIAIVTEVAKLSDKWGGLIAALPTMTFLILLWMHFEGASDGKVARHVGFTIYFLLPTLPLFFALPFIISKFGFWPAFFASILLTALLVYMFNLLYERFGVNIL